jgi:hypothetical protein
MRVIVLVGGGDRFTRAVMRAVNGKKNQQCNAVDALEKGTEVGPPFDSDESWEASSALLENR